MTRIKHISFDVWNTLLFPNPEFSFRRAEFLHNALIDDEKVSILSVKDAYTAVKKALDEEAIAGLPAMSSTDNWIRLCDSFAHPKYTKRLEISEQIVTPIEKLFMQYPPTFPEKTVQMLKDLKKSGYTLSIASNTNFISGNILHELITAATGDIFSFVLFSDITGESKPSAKMFEDILRGVNDIDPSKITCCDEILHVGDHPICDVQGAHDYGMYALLCTKPEDMYNELAFYIEEKLK